MRPPPARGAGHVYCPARRPPAVAPEDLAIIDLVLFDIDGTLISAFGAGLRSLQQAFDEVFGRPDAANSFSPAWFAGRNDLWIIREIAMQAGISPGDYEKRYTDLEAAYLVRLRENMKDWKGGRVLPGVRELLDRLSKTESGGGGNGSPTLRLGLVTGNLEQGARIKLGAYDLNRYFPIGGFGSDAIERSEIALIARRRFERAGGGEIRPESVLIVGDTIHDVSAARACGYSCIAVATGTTATADLEGAGPDLFLPDLSDPGPFLDLLERGRPF